MTTQPPAQTTQPPIPYAVGATPDGMETFVDGGLGKLIVGILTPLTRITIRKSKDAQGKVTEKTPLDTISGTVWMGVGILIVSLVIIRVIAML